MNVLPLVSAFILLFAICSYTFIHNVRTAIEEEIHFTGSQRIQRAFANRLVRKNFAKLKKEPSAHSAKKKTKSLSHNNSYLSPRDGSKKIPESKLNIRPLLEVGNHTHLEKITLDLLRELYQFAPFYKPDLEKEILSTFLDALKKQNNLTQFDKILANIPLDQVPLFYKLIKGTHQYTLHTTIGYPALGDFISIDKLQDKAPIQFCHASRPILEALFGQCISLQIIHEEKHKWKEKKKHIPMSKQELEAFLISHDCNPSDYFDFISFNTAKHASSIEIIHDTEVQMQMRIEK